MSISTFVGTTIDLLTEKLTLGRVVFVGFCLFMLVAVAALYEGYTGHFRLSRLNHATEVLTELVSVEKQLAGSNSTDLAATHRQLAQELRTFVEPQFLVFNFHQGFYRMATTACIWFVVGLMACLKSDKNRQWTAFFGLIFMSSPFVIIAGLIPSFQNLWLDILIYPVGHILILGYGSAFFININKQKQA